MKRSYSIILIIPVILILIILINKRKTPELNYFKGQIEYRYSYYSENYNIDSISKIKPSKSVFRFDMLNYQSQFFGTDTLTLYYASLINKAVSKINSTMEHGCEDYSFPSDSIHSFKMYDTDEKVLGYDCRILEIKSNIIQTRFWVSNKLRITPATYKQHKANNWSFYGEKTNGGLILKLERTFNNYIMSGIATSVSPMDNNFKALEIDEQLIKQICNN